MEIVLTYYGIGLNLLCFMLLYLLYNSNKNTEKAIKNTENAIKNAEKTRNIYNKCIKELEECQNKLKHNDK